MAPAAAASHKTGPGYLIPEPGEEIYITGVSGYFPESDSVKHLAENLFNRVDLITNDDRRWTPDPEIPHRTGKINHVEKFDASFFNVHYKRAHTMDPMGRLMLEKAYECIIDAGYNPTELRNVKTGVFVGACFSESEKELYYDKMHINDYGTTGSARAMIASNISRWLGVTGPSYAVDTACSSSMYAWEHAVKSLRDGICDAAIVGGVNLCLHPIVSHRFAKLGVLSPDGRCKSFDNKANGYVRSEAVVACFLQRAKDSRRVYAEVIHAKTNCDGYKEQGITYPAGPIQKQLLEGFYEECGVPPSSLEFVEAHGTGTQVGDPEELKAIDEVFCAGRSGPLLIGSIKSNLGHTEAASGLCSMAKVCIAYNTGFLPPNIHYYTPRDGVPGLIEGRLEVVTEKRPWGRGLAGVSSFGFGGANAHTLLKNVARDKVKNSLPSDDLPRLVCISGRTESAVAKILDDLESKPIDVDEIRLWHAIHERDIPRHFIRGYTLISATSTTSKSLARNIQYLSGTARPVWVVYSGLTSPWLTVARQLLNIPIFAAAIQRCHKALESKDVNLTKVIVNEKLVQKDSLHSFVSIVAVQIGLTDVLGIVGIKPDYVVGQGIGELGCAYADGSITAEEAILTAYLLGKVLDETKATQHNDVASKLLNVLKDVIPSKTRSKRWVSSSKEMIDKPFAEYIANSLLQQISFEEIIPLFHSNAIVIEMATSEQLNETLKTQKKITKISMTCGDEDNVQFLLTALGKLFVAGLNPQLAKIYPHVAFPVSQSTPMLSHLVEWNHSEDWCVPSYKEGEKIITAERTIKVTTEDDDLEYLLGHCIDGRVLFPATGYLVLVWETLAMLKGCLQKELSVVFENVGFHRATNLPKDTVVEFTITIHRGSGNFEIIESGVPIVTGRIYEQKNVGKNFRVIPQSKEANETEDVLMFAKDFYKELNLRGYQYKGLFRGVLGCNVQGTRGRIQWNNNWVTFLDTLMQTKIVIHDTRALYVPTRIEKLSIDVDMHLDITSKMDPNMPTMSLEYRTYPNIELTRASGVELRGLHVTAISRKPPLGIPVYERNEFVANYQINKMTLDDILRANLQLVLENIHTYKVKCIELIDEEYKKHNIEPAIERVADVLADLPLVQAELLVISEEAVQMPSHVTVANVKVSTESNTVVFIGANLLSRPNVLQEALLTLKDQCFLLTREEIPPEPRDYVTIYDISTVQYTGSEYFVLLRKKAKTKSTKYIKVITADQSYKWIDHIKEEMKDAQKLVVYSQGESINGLLGLVNCLRREPGGEIVYGLLIADINAPLFDPELAIYKEQLDKGLAINVLKNGQWGTYRHLLLKDLDTVPSPHAYVNTTTIGDLSSLRWLQGPLTENHVSSVPTEKIVHVYCSALNFRDVMTAMGRVTLDAVARGRLAQQCVQGIEISGRISSGARVMAFCEKGIANMVSIDASMMWCIPDEWSFEEAATIPVAYCTVYMAMVMIGKIRRGETILIHAGSGGVGQAAINLALHYGLEVFTTVGTPAKREFIKKLFPGLKGNHIGNSRDTSFEGMVRRETNGRGVDVVLNSLADDKLQASIKCLTRRGRFLEIGKYDITINTAIEMCFLKKEISFHGVMLDFIGDPASSKLRQTLQELLILGISSGAVRPLTNCTFEKNQIESAYRYMAAGKHIGKVIIKIRDDPANGLVKPIPIYIDAVPRYTCNGDGVYIVIGGLGGFGLELVDWLILRGARKVVLTSRKGISNGYQAMRLKIWKTYGTNVQISTHDITTESGCEEMLKLANSIGRVDAVFNLAVVLKDAVFQNQTPETFRTSYGPKALATINLDKLSRKLCPELKDFVIFSSVSCGRGNAGQTNYGFSNSVMERICEERKAAGLPALAIQWGAIGDVGLVADMQEENIQLEIGGTLQQRIISCLDAMDKFLKQEATIVSSIVVAEKRSGGIETGSSVDAIAQIMGIKDLKTVSHQAPLSELGMDSIMAVEIKQTLERDFEIFLSAQEIRMLTFARLVELGAAAGETTAKDAATTVEASEESAGLGIFMRNFGDEKLSSKPFIYMPTLVSDGTNVESCQDSEPTMFLLPGLESCASAFQGLCSKLKIKACVMQLGLKHKNETLEQMVDRLYAIVKPKLGPGAPFYLLGYSFGTLPILKLAGKLEDEGHKGVVFCLDGSPDYLFALLSKFTPVIDDLVIQRAIIRQSVNIVIPNNNIIDSILEEVDKIESYEDKIACTIKMCPVKMKYSEEFLGDISAVTFNRMKIILNVGSKEGYESLKKLKSPIVLLRPKMLPDQVECEDNYGLHKYCENIVTVHYLEADHVNIVDNDECANVINKVLTVARESMNKVTSNSVTNIIKKTLTKVSI